MKHISSLLLIFTLLASCNDKKSEKPTIFLVGDSTMSDKPYKDGNPEKGWGQLLPLYFSNSINIENHAKNGRSTKSFIDEGRWGQIVAKLKQGDYVIIQFGHNDSKADSPERYAEAYGAYTENLKKFVRETREKGATPILATPIVRRSFKNGCLRDTHGDYPKAVKMVAQELNVILFDLHKKTEEITSNFGEELSKKLYLHIDTVEYSNLKSKINDDTHLSSYGAFKVCDIVKSEIEIQIPKLSKHLKK